MLPGSSNKQTQPQASWKHSVLQLPVSGLCLAVKQVLHRAVEGSEGGPKEDLMARWKGEDGGGAM